MNKSSSPAQLLAQIAQIQSMEFGKLSEYQRPGRSKDSASYHRLQIWQDGRNHSRHVRPEELPAVREAIEGYTRFCDLTRQYAQLIVEQTRSRLEEDVKKKDPTLQSALQEEVERLLKPLLRAEPESVLQWEQLFRDALLTAGRQLFGPMLQQRVDQIDRTYQASPTHRRIGRRPLVVSTLFGDVRIERDYYLGRATGHCPADAALALEGCATPALARLVTRAAAQQPYGAASRDLAEYGAIRVDERQLQRVVNQIAPDVEPWLAQLPQGSDAVPIVYVSCDGTGTPMPAKELVGRQGKQPDGSAKTREVKLGAVFTQHRVDEEGRPVRDHDSTTYVASYAPAAPFSLLLRAEARRRGVGAAAQVVFLSDGAAWAEEIGEQCFRGCASILDFYHACERLHELANALVPSQSKARIGRWKRLLLSDRVGTVIEQGRSLQKQATAAPEIVEENLAFLERHQHRMRYGTYRRKGWFIGSGVVEAGCKTLVGKRLKQSGMFWSESGATGVLNFRTILLSRRFDAFWIDRANRHAASNDMLSLV